MNSNMIILDEYTVRLTTNTTNVQINYTSVFRDKYVSFTIRLSTLQVFSNVPYQGLREEDQPDRLKNPGVI